MTQQPKSLPVRLINVLSLVLCSFLLLACTGVPLRAIPKLMQLNSALMDANPGEFMVALQVDARMVPPAGAVPLLILKVAPREAGAFEVIDKKLPLQLVIASVATLGLEAPPSGRRWLVYSLTAGTQSELKRIQEFIKATRANPQIKGGGTLSVGVEQTSLASTDPALANTRWNTWLQTTRKDGFFEVWSGTPAQLQKMAAEAR